MDKKTDKGYLYIRANNSYIKGVVGTDIKLTLKQKIDILFSKGISIVLHGGNLTSQCNTNDEMRYSKYLRIVKGATLEQRKKFLKRINPHNNGDLIMEWHSVKDGNPNFFGRYLVVCRGIDIPQIRLYEGTWDSLNEVTHWMELPKMPKNK